MGVPGFFAWLMKRYKREHFLIKTLDKRPSRLYIDANCLFHPQCHQIIEKYSHETDKNKLEDLMIEQIIKYLNYIEHTVNPTDLLYIAVDGVAPVAKIGQQRKRRFKSVNDTKVYNSIKKKYNVPINTIWNNTSISPGTEFMEKLHQKILKHYKNRQSGKIIYSSYHTAGEGEHKILQHIKNNKNIDKNIVIYGLDADLIFLSMASSVNNIFLLRESSQVNNSETDELIYLSIDIIVRSFNVELSKINNSKYIDFINDFIFLCYFLGNDFIPQLPSLDIKREGLDNLIESYLKIFNRINKKIIMFDGNDVIINNMFIKLLLEDLSNKEEKYFNEVIPYYENKYKKQMPPNLSLCDQEIYRYDNLIGVKQEKITDKFQYYERYYGVSEHQGIFIEKMIDKYLKSLVWVSKYYFEKCTDWLWQYPYHHAPFITDIVNFLNKYDFSFNRIKFDDNKNINCMCQLLSILPPNCNELLPKSYRDVVFKNLKDMYPTKIVYDIMYKDFNWQAVPLIPYLDISRINIETNNKKLTIKEKNRNLILEEFFL